MHSVEEEQDRHAAAGEVVMVRSEVESLLRPAIIDGSHPEVPVRGIYPVQGGSQIGVLLPDGYDRVGPVPSDHVDVDISHDLSDGHGGVSGEVVTSPESF